MAQIQQVPYTGKTHTAGGRNGTSRSDDGRLNISLTPPGAKGDGTNPEQLFGAGWSACFIGAMGHVARGPQVALPTQTTVDTEVDLGTGEGGYFLQARLRVSLPGMELGLAQAIVDGAHQNCPYSKATRGNIDVQIALV
jgi:osmotically inducible protein OsmC